MDYTRRANNGNTRTTMTYKQFMDELELWSAVGRWEDANLYKRDRVDWYIYDAIAALLLFGVDDQ
jgi:hypothetical protein